MRMQTSNLKMLSEQKDLMFDIYQDDKWVR